MNVHSSLRDTDIFSTGSTFPMSFPRSTPIADLTPAATCIRFPNGCSTSTLSPMPSSWIRARAQRYTECHFLAKRLISSLTSLGVGVSHTPYTQRHCASFPSDRALTTLHITVTAAAKRSSQSKALQPVSRQPSTPQKPLQTRRPAPRSKIPYLGYLHYPCNERDT